MKSLLAAAPQITVNPSLGLNNIIGGGTVGPFLFAPSAVDHAIHSALLVMFQIVGLVVLCIFIYAGFVYMTSAGDTNKIEQSRKAMIAGVIGLLVVIFSYFITLFLIRFLGLPIGFSFTSLFNSL